MRILSPPPDLPGGLVLAQCSLCDDVTKGFLLIQPTQGGLVSLCIRCITAIVDAASEQLLTPADSQA